ncbi:GTP-binding protein [Cuneatibacter sp. NSJ-177]|uniref:COR domain-containing protein n=1 Tax=Cuneatibacter sp. NSJ-177 TaxID=2931401 RepID=UPI001FD3373B|nr:COR domain-containing protein [Cuneatibacter sp. NSJ-177]MCJ7834176.1 GTP-binding protein [Cuneatibacter sp. NSJ-177]
MREKSILTCMENEEKIRFRQVEKIDYRDDKGQYVYDEATDCIIELKLPRRIARIPEKVYDLVHLKVLDISLAKVQQLSPKIARLSSLDHINMYNTLITSLPREIGTLKKLRNINLAESPLKALPEEICELERLEKLTLWGTKIRELPEQIGKLKALKCLDLQDCRLKTLPQSILDLTIDFNQDENDHYGIRIIHLCLDDKKMEQAIRGGKQGLEQYFHSDDYLRSTYDYEVKLILLGNGAVGKTCLLNALLDNFFDVEQSKTEGIDIVDWMAEKEGQKICFHIWDFGGQEIYHTLYPLFMTKNAMYLIVLNGRSDEKPDDWLQFIETFAPEGKVILVVNRIDENPKADIDRKYYLNKYKNIVSIIRCSCKLSDHPEGNIDLLKREVIRSALDEAYRVKETPSWQNVLQAIQRANKDYLTFDEFSEVCDSCGILEQEDILETLDWLNSLGVIVSYKGAPYVVLNPEWITDSLNFIFRSATQSSYDRNDFYREMYRFNKAYNISKCEFLIQLLCKFKLCYTQDNRIFFPGLITEYADLRAEQERNWYKIAWSYSFSPILIMQRILAVYSKFLVDPCVKKNLIHFQLKGVDVVVYSVDRNIVVGIDSGQIPERRDIVSILGQTMDDIHKELNISESTYTKMMVFTDGKKEVYYKVKNLGNLKEMGIDILAVPELMQTYDVNQLLLDFPENLSQGDNLTMVLNRELKLIIDRLEEIEKKDDAYSEQVRELVLALEASIEHPTPTNKKKALKLLQALPKVVFSLVGKSADIVTLLGLL